MKNEHHVALYLFPYVVIQILLDGTKEDQDEVSVPLQSHKFRELGSCVFSLNFPSSSPLSSESNSSGFISVLMRITHLSRYVNCKNSSLC